MVPPSADWAWEGVVTWAGQGVGEFRAPQGTPSGSQLTSLRTWSLNQVACCMHVEVAAREAASLGDTSGDILESLTGWLEGLRDFDFKNVLPLGLLLWGLR